jgi:hypothetical protein
MSGETAEPRARSLGDGKERSIVKIGGLLLKLFVACTFLSLSACAADDVAQVSVRDSDFRPVKTLVSEPDLARFRELWSKKIKLSSEVKANFNYKLDLVTQGSGGGRWLYDPAGLVQALSVKQTSMYKISSPEEFNKLLGIESK